MWLRWCCSNLVQIRMWCLRPYLEGCSPLPPPPPAGSGMGGEGGPGKELISSSLSVLLFWGPTGPSLTLASAPLTREHRGPPIPARHWLPCWSRSTGAPDDTAAQGWEVGPQLGARCLCSPSTCRPVRDTVCASFCREYLNTCGRDPGPTLREVPMTQCATAATAACCSCCVPAQPRPLPRLPVQHSLEWRARHSLSTSQGSWSFSNCAESCMAGCKLIGPTT